MNTNEEQDNTAPTGMAVPPTTGRISRRPKHIQTAAFVLAILIFTGGYFRLKFRQEHAAKPDDRIVPATAGKDVAKEIQPGAAPFQAPHPPQPAPAPQTPLPQTSTQPQTPLPQQVASQPYTQPYTPQVPMQPFNATPADYQQRPTFTMNPTPPVETEEDRARRAMLAPTVTGHWGEDGKAERPGTGLAVSPQRSAAAARSYIQDSGSPQQTQKAGFVVAPGQRKSESTYLPGTRTKQLTPYELKEGAEIPAVLEQQASSDLPGQLKALVSQNVFDTATGAYVLIPQGSRLVGKYSSNVSYGQDRIQVTWDRVIYPDGSSLSLEGMTGLDSDGSAGLHDKVDRHYRRTFGMAALTSMFMAAFDISQRSAYSSGNGYFYPSVGQMAGSSVGREMSQTGTEITRKNLNVQPTIKTFVGHRFTVRVNRDIAFEEPYTYDPVMAPQPAVDHKNVEAITR